jgi:Icc-related predicted phosphoesterase
MKITCISDLHGYTPQLSGGDFLIVAGDLTARDDGWHHNNFETWLDIQQYKKIVLIAGNHDGFIEKMGYLTYYNRLKPTKYLEDTSTEFEGFKIYGSPWTPTFYNWFFMCDRGEAIKKKWDMIPDDVDILITHGPPHGILDVVEYSHKAVYGQHAGCEELAKALPRLKKLKLHVFGHIHEGYGMQVINGVTYINAAIMNQDYRPVNQPITVEI